MTDSKVTTSIDEGHITGTDAPNIRHNLIDFSTDKNYAIQWSLYVRALTVLQNMNPDGNPRSYYRMGAIHGMPPLKWPEHGLQPADPPRNIWCQHGSPRFLTWHRVHLYLFEQTLVAQTVILAEQLPAGPKRDQYVAEAKKVRQPFWDWGNKQDVPAALSAMTVTVIKITDKDETTVKNPLQSYTINGPVPGDYPKTTTRQPDASIKDGLRMIRSTVYHALTIQQGYGPFSNTRFPGTAASIEQPHNAVHNVVGRFMRNSAVAAFDPMFWIHHSSIDRYYALWQAINPDEPWQENPPTNGQPPTINTIHLPLEPFRRPSLEETWTSHMVQYSGGPLKPSHFEHGVEFPELLSADTALVRKRKALQAIQKLYSPVAEATRDTAYHYPSGCIPQSEWKDVAGYPTTLPAEAGVRREWRVAIAVRNNLVVQNFTVFFFLGQPGPPSEWGTNETTVGSYCTFKGDIESCQGCQDRDGDYIYGAIDLTESLSRLVPRSTDFRDLCPVADYLTKELSWRVRKDDGTEYPLPAGDPRFSATVESYIEAYAPVDGQGDCLSSKLADILGVTYDLQKHPEITAGAPNYH